MDFNKSNFKGLKNTHVYYMFAVACLYAVTLPMEVKAFLKHMKYVKSAMVSKTAN